MSPYCAITQIAAESLTKRFFWWRKHQKTFLFQNTILHKLKYFPSLWRSVEQFVCEGRGGLFKSITKNPLLAFMKSLEADWIWSMVIFHWITSYTRCMWS